MVPPKDQPVSNVCNNFSKQTSQGELYIYIYMLLEIEDLSTVFELVGYLVPQRVTRPQR